MFLGCSGDECTGCGDRRDAGRDRGQESGWGGDLEASGDGAVFVWPPVDGGGGCKRTEQGRVSRAGGAPDDIMGAVDRNRGKTRRLVSTF